jgi:L-Ala-D/L-Glu epimerase
MIKFHVQALRFPIKGRFTIARGSKTFAEVLNVEVRDGAHIGRGESVPYARYGETIDQGLTELEALRPKIEAGLDIDALQALMPAGAARNALDCALWDLRAKKTGIPAYATAGLSTLVPLTTAFTLSLDTPEAMGEQALQNAHRPLLKLKIGGPNSVDQDDLARIEAVHHKAPKSALIVDGNEGLSFADLKALAPDMRALGVVLIEQPLPAANDHELIGYDCPVPLCADESLHTRNDLAHCAKLYQAINIKLDKSGGLTEALRLKADAMAMGLGVMTGCMVASSLAMAPAMLLGQGVDFVDLDGPLLLAQDREGGLRYDGSVIFAPLPQLWG